MSRSTDELVSALIEAAETLSEYSDQRQTLAANCEQWMNKNVDLRIENRELKLARDRAIDLLTEFEQRYRFVQQDKDRLFYLKKTI